MRPRSVFATIRMATVIATVTVLALTVGSCKSASTQARENARTETEEVGEYLVKYHEADVELVIGFRYASLNPGEEWLLLELAITSPSGRSAEIKRGDVFVRTPDGTRIPLASQEDFSHAYGGLRSKLRKADVGRDPMDYFPPSRQPCAVEFFAIPGEGVTFDQLTVNDLRACEGRLFFMVPGGVQPGKWVFGMDLVESKIRVPFNL